MVSINSTDDVALIIFCCVFFFLGTISILFSLFIYRHNQKTKTKEYQLRYQRYINALFLLGFSMWILSIGKLLPLIDIGEYKTSEYGWWIFFTLYIGLIMMTEAMYHKLSTFGVVISLGLGIFTGVSFIMLSLFSIIQGEILFGVLSGLLIIITHFFIWWKSQRNYETTFSREKTTMDGFLSYWFVDKLLLIISLIGFILCLLFLILSPEVTDQYNKLVNVILNGCTLFFQWIGIYFIVFFWFMDVQSNMKKERIRTRNNNNNNNNMNIPINIDDKKDERIVNQFNWSNDERGPNYVHNRFNPFDEL
jgi:hypothetical protein